MSDASVFIKCICEPVLHACMISLSSMITGMNRVARKAGVEGGATLQLSEEIAPVMCTTVRVSLAGRCSGTFVGGLLQVARRSQVCGLLHVLATQSDARQAAAEQ